MLKYKFALCNVFWSENDINTRHFENITQQNEYFDELTRGVFTPLSNFNMGDNISTTIVYRDNTGREPSELVRCNYLVLHRLNEENEIVERRYYFASVKQDDGNQLIININLDDIQTNYFKYKDKISKCIIRKALLKRYKRINEEITFDLDINSHLLETQTEIKSKILKSRNRVKFKHTSIDSINNWLHDNIAYWVYVYLDNKQDYNVYQVTDNNRTTYNQTLYKYSYNNEYNISDFGIIAYPVYQTDKKIYIRTNDKDIKISYAGYSGFRSINNDSSYFYNVKISMVCPFDYINNFNIENGNLIITPVSVLNNSYGAINNKHSNYSPNFIYSNYAPGSTTPYSGVITNITQDIKPIESYEITLDNYKNTFTVSEIKNNSNNYNYNPKISSEIYKSFRLCGSNGDYYEYDYQKVNNEKIILLYTETLQPDITRYYCRIKAPSGLYSEGYNSNYNGLVGSVDNSVIVTQDRLGEFLANNKNFWLQSNTKILESMINTGINTATSMIHNNYLGAGTSLVQGGVSLATSLASRSYNIDNMASAPDSMKNANGNVVFNVFVNNEMGIFIEEYDCIEVEKEDDNYNMMLYGFTYNHLGKIDDYTNIRKYFNYIEADIDCITAPISNFEKERLKQKLSKVRFWNIDEVNYNLQNYERELD